MKCTHSYTMKEVRRKDSFQLVVDAGGRGGGKADHVGLCAGMRVDESNYGGDAGCRFAGAWQGYREIVRLTCNDCVTDHLLFW